MTRDFTVRYLGRDSSGRGLYMTQWMLDVFNAIKRHPLVEPFAYKIVPVQGAFMIKNGGGANASDGFHNYAGCLDIRTWNLTTREIDLFIRAARLLGFGFWRRDYSWQHGGMSPHAHGVLGTDYPMGYYAPISWSSYVTGGDGLSGPGRDYEWRPAPLVLYPPADLMEEDWFMSSEAERTVNAVDRKVTRLLEDVAAMRKGSYKRDTEILEGLEKAAEKAKASKKALVSSIAGVGDELTLLINKPEVTKEDLRRVQNTLLAALAADPDVDGKDNPAPEEEQ